MLQTWLQAVRPRTLLLSSAPILAGASIALLNGRLEPAVLILALTTSFLLQVISNLANDLGDFKKGTDNQERLGPQRVLQSGGLSPLVMQRAVIVVSVAALTCGSILLWIALDGMREILLFLGVGILCIAAAWGYTLGKKAYGYLGLGDLAVLLFFGFAGTLGSTYLFTHQIPASSLMAAIGIGSMAVLVLNLNNMRDVQNDMAHGKHTLASRLGPYSKWYHAAMTIAAVAAIAAYQHLTGLSFYWLIPGMIILLIDLILVLRTKDPVKLDPHLAVIGIGTFITSLAMFLGQLNHIG